MGNPHIVGYWRSAIGYSTAPAAAVKGEMGKSAYHRLLAIGYSAAPAAVELLGPGGTH
jgi:hypothetical protein